MLEVAREEDVGSAAWYDVMRTKSRSMSVQLLLKDPRFQCYLHEGILGLQSQDPRCEHSHETTCANAIDDANDAPF